MFWGFGAGGKKSRHKQRDQAVTQANKNETHKTHVTSKTAIEEVDKSTYCNSVGYITPSILHLPSSSSIRATARDRIPRVPSSCTWSIVSVSNKEQQELSIKRRKSRANVRNEGLNALDFLPSSEALPDCLPNAYYLILDSFANLVLVVTKAQNHVRCPLRNWRCQGEIRIAREESKCKAWDNLHNKYKCKPTGFVDKWINAEQISYTHCNSLLDESECQ